MLGNTANADEAVYIEATKGSVTAEKAIESIDKNVTVTGDNGVTLKDKVTAGTDVTVTSGAGNATLVGAVLAETGAATVKANGTVTTSGTVQAGKGVTLTSQSGAVTRVFLQSKRCRQVRI